MKKEDKNYDSFLVLHPLLEQHEFNAFKFPIIKKDNFILNEFNNLEIVNFLNISSVKNKSNTAVIMFNYDNILERIWRNPFKYLIKFLGFKAICTPDFSIYPGMNENDVRYNVYRNRWVGAFLQEHNIKVIPTIQRGGEETFDVCFSGIEKGSIVCVSTLGCIKNAETFLKGFNEMKKRIKPELIIVFGQFIRGMTGKLICFDYEDSFNKKNINYSQLTIEGINKIFELKEDIINGQ